MSLEEVEVFLDLVPLLVLRGVESELPVWMQ